MFLMPEPLHSFGNTVMLGVVCIVSLFIPFIALRLVVTPRVARDILGAIDELKSADPSERK